MQGIAASQGGVWQCDMDFARGASAEFCTEGQNLHEDCRRIMCKYLKYHVYSTALGSPREAMQKMHGAGIMLQRSMKAGLEAGVSFT